jgi:hypothetical protein
MSSHSTTHTSCSITSVRFYNIRTSSHKIKISANEQIANQLHIFTYKSYNIYFYLVPFTLTLYEYKINNIRIMFHSNQSMWYSW